MLDDPECINDLNCADETPWDLLEKNKSIEVRVLFSIFVNLVSILGITLNEANAKEKCQRLLKPGAIASELSRRVDELARLRLDLLRKPKKDENSDLKMRRRVRPIVYEVDAVESTLKTEKPVTSSAPQAIRYASNRKNAIFYFAIQLCGNW